MATPARIRLSLARRLGADRNPLRRRADVLEAWLAPVAIAMFLALVPVVLVVSSMWIRADNAAVQRAESTWHPVTAVLLRSTPGPEFSDNGGNTWTTWTLARWTTAGRQHVAEVPAPAGSSAGSKQTVWLDGAGKPQLPPLNAAQVGSWAVAATAMTMAVFAVLLAILAWLGRRALDRRRLADWETAWLAVGPIWSRQR